MIIVSLAIVSVYALIVTIALINEAAENKALRGPSNPTPEDVTCEKCKHVVKGRYCKRVELRYNSYYTSRPSYVYYCPEHAPKYDYIVNDNYIGCKEAKCKDKDNTYGHSHRIKKYYKHPTAAEVDVNGKVIKTKK